MSVIALILTFLTLFLQEVNKSNQEYSDHVCQVYGYQTDCVTPLK